MNRGPLEFIKGHGTGNDFLLIPDPEGRIELDADLVARICDRHFGVGADGLIRAIRADSGGGRPIPGGAAWFMDYRNADGSTAEMCGNGARVMARHLIDECLETRASFPIATRGGVREVRQLIDGCIAVEMGAPASGPPGMDPSIELPDRVVPGFGWWMPNPHVVTWLSDLADAGNLDRQPGIHSDRFPSGANVEFAVDLSDGAGALAAGMRVHERGVGETLSCGTGACAVALDLRRRRGVAEPGRVQIEVPGGMLTVSIDEQGRIWLAGRAVIVAHGRLTAEWLADG